MRRWRLPIGLVAAGAVVSVMVSRLPQWWVQVRQFYVLGFTPRDVYYLLFFVGPLAILVGLFIATRRLASDQRTRSGAVPLGILTFAGGAVFCFYGVICLIFAQIDDLTEVALDDGRSIVVSESSWRDCEVYVHQRDGIYVDIPLGSGDNGLPCGAFSKGDYTVEQHGDEVTLRAGDESLTVTLR